MDKTIKRCGRCKNHLSILDFYCPTSGYCKPCECEYQRVHRRLKRLTKIQRTFIALVEALGEAHHVNAADIDLYAYYSDGRELMALTVETSI